MINESLLRTILQSITNIGPRVTGTYGCEQAAAYIYQQFNQTGLQTRYQNWTGWGNRWHPGKFNSQNVEATLKGVSDKIILFNAHYDCVDDQGADDNGDGAAAVVAAAYVLSHFTFNNTLKFVTFSGEEEGLLGSHAYAKEAYENKEDIAAAFNADMIGYATAPGTGHQARTYATEDLQYVLDLIADINETYNLGFYNQTVGVTREAQKGGSDYYSFVQYGYEVVAFFEKDWDPYMHTPQDTIDKVNMSYLVNMTKLIVATMAYLGDHGMSHPQIKIASPRFGKWYFDGREHSGFQDVKTTVIGSIYVWADVKPGDASIQRVDFYLDTTLVFTDTEAPFMWHLNTSSIRNHNITAVVYDMLGQKAHDWKTIRYLNFEIQALLGLKT
jgi:hypothetical protein